jgi:hypothetical protein
MEDTMQQKHRSILLIGSAILLLIVACGRTAPPAPITNPSSVETSLASTARAFAKQTEAANPFTLTPSPTLTPTSTPTPRISLNGTSLVLRDDKSTLFTDHKLGFQLIVPPGWLPVRINEDEYYKAFTLQAVSENAAIVDFLTQLQNQDTNYFRLVALDVRPGQASDGMISGMAVILQFEAKKTLEDWAQTKSVYANSKGYQLHSSKFRETASGIRILVREESWNSLSEGKTYHQRVFFSLPAGVLTISFETDLAVKDALLPDFEQVINSITLLAP